MSPLARVIIVTALACCALVAPPFPAARGEGCGTLPSPVGCGASAGSDGAFHGVIGVVGQDWLLEVSSHSGHTPGCGDCTWTVVLDCPHSSPNDPGSAPGCAGISGGYTCPVDQVPYRLYLTTDSATNQLVGTVCLGGASQIVEVGADAEADVERYLRDVTPPDLLIATRPHGPTLTGLPTYFTASPPEGRLAPVTFGGPTVSEVITLRARQARWSWGDGADSGWLAIDAVASHRYLSAGKIAGTLTTVWSATYVASFDGQTVGPFDAVGTLERVQPFIERVDTSAPVLVSP